MITKFKLILEGSPYEIDRKEDLLIINGREYPVSFDKNTVLVSGTPHTVEIKGNKAFVDGISHAFEAQGLEEPKPGKRSKASSTVAEVVGAITALMPGLIIKVLKKEGDRVNAGDTVLILEAMKMQNELQAKKAGVIKQITVKEGESVEMRQVLAVIE